jgi:DNA-binding transcriptional MerR regulator
LVERAYLSIGDVLSLLREEFPDVTISKIRFLESQGLLDPERTPSGYRKFYEDDVERLRWILRQQRENFLPLKVIRDRLGTEQGERPADEDAPSPEGTYEAPALQGSASSVAGAEGASSGADAPPPTVVPSSAVGVTARQPEPEGSGRSLINGAPTTTGAGDGPGRGASGVGGPGDARGSGAASIAGDRTGGDGRQAGRREGRPAGMHGGLAGGPTSVSLTLDELSGASGLDAEALRELERYGLIAGRSVAGTLYYDHEALTVARLAGGFGRMGIEPRHLRMYKTAADREAGFFEQIVTPLLRQRNPAARQRANDTLAELVRLGHDLRAALLRISLREQTGV